MQSASQIHPRNLPIANPATLQSRALPVPVARRTPSPEQNKLQPGVSFERLAELWCQAKQIYPEKIDQQNYVVKQAMHEHNGGGSS